MLTVRVETPRYCTAPRSFMHSISASATPAASAGRASGSATDQKAPADVRPSVRATSSTQIDCCTKLARAER